MTDQELAGEVATAILRKSAGTHGDQARAVLARFRELGWSCAVLERQELASLRGRCGLAEARAEVAEAALAAARSEMTLRSKNVFGEGLGAGVCERCGGEGRFWSMGADNMDIDEWDCDHCGGTGTEGGES